MPYGAIYIAHNPRDGENTFKVGKTERIVEERMKDLTSSTSNLGIYTARAYFVVHDIDAAEQACHRALHRYRIQDNREFFDLQFSRLIRIVSEQIQPFVARSVVPEQQGDDQPPKQLSAKDLLKSAREQHRSVTQLWDEALASAMETVSRWSSLIHDKAVQASEELRDEITLKWHIRASAEKEGTLTRPVPLCSVTVVCLFSKEPLVLWQSGGRGGIYGDLDLSRVIGKPQVRQIDDKSEWVTWLEPDDGRVGRIELMAHIEHAMQYDRERAMAPLPKILVRATPVRYSTYHQNFEAAYQREKSYSDPEQAFEEFLALVVENAKLQQYDVRAQSKGFRGELTVYDRSKFEMHLFEDQVEEEND